MSTSQIQTFENWEDIPNINTNILRGIYGAGFEKPSPIQSKAIHPIINGRNIVAQAQSGTGKTCAFITGALHLINTSKNENQVLVLLPTRELSIQVYDVFTQLSKFIKNIKSKLLIGGTSISDDLQYFKYNTPHIIIGSMGRIVDLTEKKHIHLENIKCIIFPFSNLLVNLSRDPSSLLRAA